MRRRQSRLIVSRAKRKYFSPPHRAEPSCRKIGGGFDRRRIFRWRRSDDCIIGFASAGGVRF
ncbi:unnamed protein product [Rhodiola kirilowii]